MQTPTTETLWLEIKTYLEEKKNLINEEIIHYPPPIPACDAQFNYLLEERARLAEQLNRLEDICRHEANDHETNDSDSLQSIQDFIESCAYIDHSLKTAWRLHLNPSGLV